MKPVLNEKGSIKAILGLAVLVALVFMGMTFARPYYRYYAMGSHTRDFLKTDIGDVNAIRQNIMKDADELRVPLDDSDLSVTIDKKVVKVKASWTETVDLFGYYRKDIDFVMEEEY